MSRTTAFSTQAPRPIRNLNTSSRWTRRGLAGETLIRVLPNRVLLDAYSRRHEGQKIYLRQAAAQRWIEFRESILQGERQHSGNESQLRACDQQLRLVRDPDPFFIIPLHPLSECLPPPIWHVGWEVEGAFNMATHSGYSVTY
jgi:hypothetical protein